MYPRTADFYCVNHSTSHKQLDHKHQHTANDRHREKPCIPAQNTLRQRCVVFPVPIAFLYFIIAQAQGKRKGGPQKCCRAAAILTPAPSYFTMNTKGVFTMSRDSIKMVAMLTMLINHIANVFLPAGSR